MHQMWDELQLLANGSSMEVRPKQNYSMHPPVSPTTLKSVQAVDTLVAIWSQSMNVDLIAYILRHIYDSIMSYRLVKIDDQNSIKIFPIELFIYVL